MFSEMTQGLLQALGAVATAQQQLAPIVELSLLRGAEEMLLAYEAVQHSLSEMGNEDSALVQPVAVKTLSELHHHQLNICFRSLGHVTHRAFTIHEA